MKRNLYTGGIIIILLMIVSAVNAAAINKTMPENEQPNITELTKGVYVIEHPDAFLGEPSGNTTVIIGSQKVLVVDAVWPISARTDIELIRQWTDLPVSYVVNTHWHSDHNIGNKTYMDAFPGLSIIAQKETKKDMDIVFKDYANMILGNQKRMLSEGKIRGEPLSPEVREIIEKRLPDMEAQFEGYVYQPPTLMFEDELVIDLGGREVQIKHPGKGNTSGDAVVYLPEEKILAAGDLLVHPFPYPYDGYPSEWIKTLETLGQLDIKTIVPGHGTVLHDKTYLYLVRDFFQSAVSQMNKRMGEAGPALSRSLDLLKQGIDLSSFKTKFASNDEELLGYFDSISEQVIKLVYQEAALR
ncbi:MAG: hypothetical protein A2068_02835 [Ignavibacteria bacterium GWB2_35_6b]|nr:MAG: hypothetical protein A2068_02835 [Ignavibacteria bacterium GWB2_35_6b]